MLTERQIHYLKVTGQAYRFRDNTGDGFGVQVSAKGAKNYFVCYRFAGAKRFYNLGKIGDISLVEARIKSEGIRQQVREGIDPQHARDETVKATVKAKREHAQKATVAELFNDYIEALRAAKKRSADGVRYLLDQVANELDGKRKASEVEKTDVSEFIKAKAKTAGTMANRLHQAVRAAFQFGIDADETSRTKRYAIAINPGAFNKLYEEAKREHHLSAAELRLLWKTIGSAGTSPQIHNVIVLVLACGGCRIQEAVNAKWSEFDFSARVELSGWAGVWNIPPGRTKNDEGNTIPLTQIAAAAVNAMREITGSSPFVFASPNDASVPLAWRSVNRALRRWSQRHEIADFQARDLRRSCKTMLADHLSADEGLMARLHGHAMSRVDQKVYNRARYSGQKLALLLRWVDWLNDEPKKSKVTPMRKVSRASQ